MSEINNGGPAFPTLAVVGDAALSDGGLSVRDYFAAHAPISWQDAIKSIDCSEERFGPWPESKIIERLVLLRNDYADAMLAARASSAQPAAEPEPAAPDAGGWIEWGGGECPAGQDAHVEVVLRSGDVCGGLAVRFHWDHRDQPGDIVRYRVVGAKP